MAARLACGFESIAYRDAFSVGRQYQSFARDTVAFLVGIVLYRSVLWRFLYPEEPPTYENVCEPRKLDNRERKLIIA